MKTFKKVLALLLVVALTATAAVNLTLAYLQDQDEDVNVMTLGNVYIDQTEEERDENGELVEFEQDKPLYPAIGDLAMTDGYWTNNNVVDKIVTVTNTGASEAYVRTVYAFEVNGNENFEQLLHINWNVDPKPERVGVITVEGAQYVMYEHIYGIMQPGDSAVTLKQVALDKTAVNEDVVPMGSEYKILVVSQAIQTNGFDDAETALNTGFYDITTESHPWVNGAIGDPWNGNDSNTEPLNPDEEEANTKVIEIYTPSQLKAVADKVNGVSAAEVATFAATADEIPDDFKGWTVKLMADINLNNKEWTPIGFNGKIFKGTFDGNGYTVSNLNVNMPGKNDVGLFGYTTDGEIKNLTVENATVTGRGCVGVVAGTPYTSKYTNITVKGHVEVNALFYAGGVGGMNAYADWDKITVDVDDTSYVKAVSTEDGKTYRTYVGGVVGFRGEGGHKMSNVKSNIDVIGSTIDVGGISGIAHYGNIFENIECSGNVSITNGADGDAEEMGGIAAVWHNKDGYTVTFTNCSFTGTLTANNTTGVDLSDNTIVGKAYSASGNGKLIIDDSMSVVIQGVRVMLTQASYNSIIYHDRAGYTDKVKSIEVYCKDDLDSAVKLRAAGVIVHNGTNDIPAELIFKSDIDYGGANFSGLGKGINIIGNGYTLSNVKFIAGDDGKAGFISYAGNNVITGLTIKDCVVEGAQAGVFAGNASKVTLTDCALAGNISVTYVASASESCCGVGAVFGVNAEGASVIDVDVSGANITIVKDGITYPGSFTPETNDLVGVVYGGSYTIVP